MRPHFSQKTYKLNNEETKPQLTHLQTIISGQTRGRAFFCHINETWNPFSIRSHPRLISTSAQFRKRPLLKSAWDESPAQSLIFGCRFWNRIPQKNFCQLRDLRVCKGRWTGSMRKILSAYFWILHCLYSSLSEFSISVCSRALLL